MFRRSLFVLLAFVLSVLLQFTAYDCPFGIFKLFWSWRGDNLVDEIYFLLSPTKTCKMCIKILTRFIKLKKVTINRTVFSVLLCKMCILWHFIFSWSRMFKSILSHNMGLFSLDDEVRVPCFCSQRWILAYTAFLGFVCLYAVRFNLSVAIVCMVRTEPKNNSATESVNHTAGLCTGTVESVKLSNQVTLF